ncbi:MAG TPA: sugar phosphate isomerase/epimerase [Solirubrobacteraceae bacterium]|jgi:sugar phosphate isomerase/epimerase|nr:sugar phosphate isomerase/epimerase [Solirubrobacteraceae bacterium]
MGTELVALYWTVAGPVEVHTGREWSLFSWEDRCRKAAEVGYWGLGLWVADIEHQLEQGATLQSIRKTADEHGVRIAELEFLQDWFMPAGSSERAEADKTKELMLEAAEAFDPHHLKAGNIPARDVPLEQVTEAFAALCDEAARHTDAPVAYELIPSDPIVHDLATLTALVEGSGRPNAGMAIDTWHLSHLDVPLDEVRALPRERITWVELSDGRYHGWKGYENLPDVDTFVHEVTRQRELPGEGEFPIADYIAALREAGYEGPWGVEVLSDALRALPFDEIFERSYETTAAQFAAQGGSPT